MFNTDPWKLVENGSMMALPATDSSGQRTAALIAAKAGHVLPPVVSYQQGDGSSALSHELGHLDLSQIVTLNQGVPQVK